MSVLAALLVTFVWQGPAESKKAPSIREQLPLSLVQQIRSMEADYGIEIALDHSDFAVRIQSDWIIQGNPATAPALIIDLPVYIKELSLYPPELFRKARLKRFLFCHNLNLAKTNSYIGGVADALKDSLYYNLHSDRKAIGTDWLVNYLHTTIHHEFFHFVDYRISRDIHLDPKWQRLNSPTFAYVNPSTIEGDNEVLNVTSRFPGFISRYAQMNAGEDKAETFGHMMQNLHEMECRAKDDPILARKMDRIKQMLQEFSPEMDERFWTKIRNLKRPRLTLVGKEDPWADAHPILPPLPKVIEAVPKVVEPVVVVESEIKRMPMEQSCVTIRRRCRCCR